MTDQDKMRIIIWEVCTFLSLQEEELKTKCRERELVEARNFIFYFSRIYTNLSFKAIGLLFNRDHASVLYACDWVDNLIRFNKYGPLVDKINNNIKSKIGYDEIDKWVLSMGTF